MKIGEVIRSYRKEAGLTQEQVASYLGVTAPAVNKWENGNSCPDIALLAPLARILNTNVDTLLSFNEKPELSEINALAEEVNGLLRTKGIHAAFARAEELIHRYSGSDLLMLCLAQILYMQLVMEQEQTDTRKNVPEELFCETDAQTGQEQTDTRKNAPEELFCEAKAGNQTGKSQADVWMRKIITWYELVASGQDENLANQARLMLVTHHQKNGEYEKAQNLLNQMPDRGLDKRQIQANLYAAQGKEDDACRLYEQMVFQYACELNSALLVLMEKRQQGGKPEEAEQIGQIIRQFAELLELGDYNKNAAEYYLAAENKDAGRMFRALEGMTAYLEKLEKNPNEERMLYPHLNGRKMTPETAERYAQRIREMLLYGLKYDKELEFLRGDNRYLHLLKWLDSKIESK